MQKFGAIAVLVFSFMSGVQVKDKVREDPVYVGCYMFINENIYLYEPTNVGAANTVEECVAVCADKYYRYAAIKNAEKCSCGSSLEDHGATVKAECNKYCNGNLSQPCGGSKANSVYDTGERVAGPPNTLQVANVSDTMIEVTWTPPKAANGEINSYTVTAAPNHTYARTTPVQTILLTYQSSVTSANIIGLHPGTEYQISVSAITAAGTGVPKTLTTYTQIGEPNEPDVPEIISRHNGRMNVRLSPAFSENGPISAYRIIVLEGKNFAFDENLLKSYEEAQKDGSPYYIAAELKPEEFRSEFTVGDNKTYGGYYNPPIPELVDTHVSLGVLSTVNDTTRASYARVTHEQHNGILILNVEGSVAGDDSPSGLVMALSVAIGVFGFLLILSTAAYFVLRQRLGRRRRAPDHQELSLQGPIIEVESNSYIHNGYVPEEEEERPNHYEKLKQQVWNIPRNFLEVKTDVLGSGTYGHVVKGTVQQRGFPVPVAIHAIDDVSLEGGLRKNMLKDLDVLIRVGTNLNVVHLVGLCETPEMLFVVLEHHPASLKDILLESRQQQHLEKAQSRICSLPEQHILEVIVGIAHAMDHLTSRKILHKQLCARNILMADGMIPKVCGFGIAQYTKNGIVPDYTRWTAQEIFRGRYFVSKSDVWSFGVTLWEITALGGTPYAEVSNTDVPARVMRGLRLAQLPVVGDDLYQLMLQCWQLDLDERPTFSEIVCILKNMLEDTLVHLNFSASVGVHYQQYFPDLEMQK
ncbi:putative inactive tyrosine-protein kinase Wsck [Schistocerca serialis cubense]|uniref:putative inactive tyrosine-protein kinase Wsck n=1 Tax=Schistocerca serialis cubense TaxID=2023355 RepID=UPI00214E6D29|nr:putative inactive tyrosine-protein kinase Wsck [Schistocerca serialis cubense]